MYWADISKAKRQLDWDVTESIDTMVIDTLNYLKSNILLYNLCGK